MTAVVLSGFAAAEQARLAALCAAAGLAVLPRLDAGACDVCVAKDVRAEAYQAARDRGVPVVREAWVDACARAGAAVSCDDAALRLPPFAGLRISVTGVAPDERLAIKAHTEANGGAYHAELTKSKCTHLIASSTQSEKYQYALRWGTVKVVSLAWFEQCLHTQVCLDEARFPVVDKDASGERVRLCLPGAQQPLKTNRTDVASAAQSVDDITCGTGDAQAHTAAITDPLYLSSCRVFFSGIDQVAASGGACAPRDLLALLWTGGGTCVDDINAATHMVVMHSERGPGQGAESHPMPPAGCKVVSVQWLRACRSAAQLVPTERFAAGTNARHGVGGQGVRVTTAAAASATVWPKEAVAAMRLSDRSASGLVFHGKVFTLMQSLNESERAEVEALILQGGGTLSGVAAVAHFVVCPLVLSARGEAGDVVWLRECVLYAHQLVSQERILFQPLLASAVPASGVLGFEALKLCITMCEEPVRGGISELCKMLGIKLSSRLTRNKTTHLICGEDGAHSEKRINAEAWGSVLLVTPDWLFQSVCRGQRQSEDAFPVGAGVAAPLQLDLGPDDHAPLQHVLPVRPAAQASPPAAAAPSFDAGQAVVSELPSTRPRTSDDPVDMLDVVARLTSAAKQTGKRRTSFGGELDSGASGSLLKGPVEADQLAGAVAMGATKHRGGTPLLSHTVCASQVEESQLQLGYGDAVVGAHKGVNTTGDQLLDAGGRDSKLRKHHSEQVPTLQRLFAGPGAVDSACAVLEKSSWRDLVDK